MDDSRAPHHVIQATTSEGLAQSPYVAASGIEPATFRTKHHQSATTPLKNLRNKISSLWESSRHQQSRPLSNQSATIKYKSGQNSTGQALRTENYYNDETQCEKTNIYSRTADQ